MNNSIAPQNNNVTSESLSRTIPTRRNRLRTIKIVLFAIGIATTFIGILITIPLILPNNQTLTAILNHSSTSFETTSIQTPNTTSCTTKTTTMTVTRDRNLLVNPGGEDGVIIPWIVGGTSNPGLDNGTLNQGFFPRTGSFQFSGNNGQWGTLTQTVFIVGGNEPIVTTQIDTGNLCVTVLFWTRCLDQLPNDAAAVTLYFLDALNNTLANVTTPEQAVADTYALYSNSYSIPVGTRSIQYQMKFIRYFGTDLDAYIDDNFMIIN